MNVVYEKMKNMVPVKCCVKERENGDFLVVSNHNADIFFLNETAKDFFALCDGNRTLSAICGELLSIYDTAAENLEADLVPFIRDMQWSDILGLKDREA